MRFRSLATLGVALALAGTAACNDTTNPNGSFTTGLYALTTVNGTAIPYTYNDQTTGGTTTVQSDVYTINSDGTYSEVINESTATSFGTTPRTDNEQGTWTQYNGTVTFQPTYSSFSNALTPYSGSMASGGLNGNGALVFSSSLGQLVYQHE